MARRLCLCSILAAVLLPAGVADASRPPSKSEAKAIKKGFLKGRSKAGTTVTRIRVSTADRRYASVAYRAEVKTSTPYKAPAPEVVKKSGKSWKPVTAAKVPAKVKKDLKAKKPASDVTLSGEVSARFTRPARCDGSGVSIYDKGADLRLSIQQFTGKGTGIRPALGVGTVVAVYRNRGTELAYESGQPNDANAESGFFYRDKGGWGIVDADLAPPPVPDIKPFAVSVKGTWDCG
jgi:hypothetical protein